ncbi:MAG TPA: hypothetical protein ACFCUY_01965 [Xenococcaceae cyanobacterium]
MNKPQKLQPIDSIAIALITFLSLIMGLLIWNSHSCSDRCWFEVQPQVEEFSWQNLLIGAEDKAFLMTFNRPMDRQSVEQNLAIEPPLPGKFSWAGNKLAYTLRVPAPYGETYRVFLQKARQRFAQETELGQEITPFFSQFQTRDRAFAYLGSEAEERGRLILYNWTQQQKTILTPENLTVFDFEPYPQGDRILFSAADKSSGIDGIRMLQLYTVTTGLNDSEPNSQLKLVLDNQEYQNNKFDLSQDGKTIVLQRLNRNNPQDFGLWVLQEDNSLQPLKNSTGGDFLVTPDSKTLAVAQGEGIALFPLQPEAEPLDFLPKFGRVVSFSADGMAAAMINYNTDNQDLKYTRSLFYVNNQGVQKELLNLAGSIIDCQFNPTATQLYCLLSELKPGDEYREQPYLAAIDLKTSETTPLLALPEYQDSRISIAPDGLGVLFDQVLTTDTLSSNDITTTDSGETIVTSRLWLLIPPSETAPQHQVEQLPFIGFNPQWIP